MRLLLFAGKGGVGTTTAAAASALAAARSGRSTLLASLEAEPELGGLLGMPEASFAAGEPVAVEERLDACHLDPQDDFERLWTMNAGRLAGVAEPFGVDVPEADSLTVPPGLDRLLALARLRALAGSGRWDVIAVDCAAGRHAPSLLALPETAARQLAALLPAERQVVRALRPVLASFAGVPMPPPEAFDVAAGAHAELAAASALLTAPGTTVRLVSSTAPAALAAARRMACVLSLFEIGVDGLMLTGPDTATGTPADADGTAGLFGPVAVHRVPWQPAPPVGPDRLADLGAAAYRSGAPGAEAYGGGEDPAEGNRADGGETVPRVDAVGERLLARPGPTVEPDGDGYLYRIPLPFVQRGTTGLVRHGDELVVSVGRVRRVLTLPSALRRCAVRRARLSGGALTVSFTPDDSVWMRRP